jgi:hypothetical protein
LARPRPEAVIQRLWEPLTPETQAEIYAILDAARDPRIYQGIRHDSPEAYCSLYRGEQAEELQEVAPYLVRLHPETPLTRWLIDLGWGESWGIFLESSASMRELRRHFRRFLMVYDEEGKPLYFRYYDPRVLRLYLPTCNGAELHMLFGPVDRYCAESEDGAMLLEYRRIDGQLRQRRVRFDL